MCVCADQQVYAVQRQRYLAHQRNIQDSAPVHINSNGTDDEEEEDDGSGYHVSNTDAYSGTRALEKQQQQDSFDDYSGRLDGGEEQEYDNGREDVRGLTEEDKTIKVRTPVHAYMHMHTNTNERKHNVIHTTHRRTTATMKRKKTWIRKRRSQMKRTKTSSITPATMATATMATATMIFHTTVMTPNPKMATKMAVKMAVMTPKKTMATKLAEMMLRWWRKARTVHQ